MADPKVKKYQIESSWLDKHGVLHPAGSVITVSAEEKPARGWKLLNGDEKAAGPATTPTGKK